MRQVWVLVISAGFLLLSTQGCRTNPPDTVSATNPPEAPATPPDPDAALHHGQFFDKGRRPVLTGWEDQPERLKASYCQGCHTSTHSQWTQGLHSKAWTDPVFAEAFSKEERLWCVHCHAPLDAQRDQYLATTRLKTSSPASSPAATPAPNAAYAPSTPTDLLAEGINCAACHVREGKILGTKPSNNPDHEVVVSPYLGRPEFCADCHQFNFPNFEGGQINYTAEPMQNTYQEWRTMAPPGTTCQGCHYRDGHQLMGPHNADWMRAKFDDFQFTASGPLLTVRFRAAPRGHLVPSGDLFHSLSLEVATEDTFKRLFVQRKWARFYRRGFLAPGVVWDRVLEKNAGLRPDERAVSVTVDMPPDPDPVFARLVYYYHDHHLGGRTHNPPELQYLVLWQAQVR